MLPSLRPRVKRLMQDDFDVLSHPKVALNRFPERSGHRLRVIILGGAALNPLTLWHRQSYS